MEKYQMKKIGRSKQYGDKWKKNDIIEMKLDFNKKELQFKLNEKIMVLHLKLMQIKNIKLQFQLVYVKKMFNIKLS